MVFQGYFYRVGVFNCRIKFSKTFLNKCFSIRLALGRIDTEFLRDLQGQTFHKHRGLHSLCLLLANFQIKLYRAEDSCSGGEYGVQNTHVPLFDKGGEADGCETVDGRDDEDRDVITTGRCAIGRVFISEVLLVCVTLLLQFGQERLLPREPLLDEHPWYCPRKNAPRPLQRPRES